jgi:hypothetical protein
MAGRMVKRWSFLVTRMVANGRAGWPLYIRAIPNNQSSFNQTTTVIEPKLYPDQGRKKPTRSVLGHLVRFWEANPRAHC